MTKNIFLANSIFVFHCLVVLFVLFIPFTNIPAFLILHITFALCLFVHWYANSNVCSLTIMESQFRGLDRTETFSHKFIAPIYEISESEWSNLIWIITFIVMCISVYKLYHTKKFNIAMECYKNGMKHKSMYKNIVEFINCFAPLFVI